jgi:hypothetical protein
VLVRFGLKTAVMVALSAFGSIDFNKTFAALMWTAIVFCITPSLSDRLHCLPQVSFRA